MVRNPGGFARLSGSLMIESRKEHTEMSSYPPFSTGRLPYRQPYVRSNGSPNGAPLILLYFTSVICSLFVSSGSSDFFRSSTTTSISSASQSATAAYFSHALVRRFSGNERFRELHFRWSGNGLRDRLLCASCIQKQVNGYAVKLAQRKQPFRGRLRLPALPARHRLPGNVQLCGNICLR